MNVNKLILDTLKPLGHPVVFNIYEGEWIDGKFVKKDIYITFNYEDERGELFADDEPITDIAYLQIHLFAPINFNFMSLKKQIRSRLFRAGFSYPTITTIYEEETKTNHLVYQCSIEGASETEE